MADCADVDDDGRRDDLCVWWACTMEQCAGIDIVYADMGGQFGACPVDGTADNNDRNHALNCFADDDAGGDPATEYPCEDDPPNAYNVDAGGQFGSCIPDGVCDGNDAFAALNAFAGTTSCSCPLDGSPLPSVEPPIVAVATLSLVAGQTQVAPGAVVTVQILLDTPLDDLRGYQLHIRAGGGRAGALELIDIAVDPQSGPTRAARAAAQPVFGGLGPWMAFNVVTGQMVAGLDGPGVAVDPGYLATFTFRVSADAVGRFVVDLLADPSDPRQRTYLFPTTPTDRIAVTTGPAIISVEDPLP